MLFSVVFLSCLVLEGNGRSMLLEPTIRSETCNRNPKVAGHHTAPQSTMFMSPTVCCLLRLVCDIVTGKLVQFSAKLYIYLARRHVDPVPQKYNEGRRTMLGK